MATSFAPIIVSKGHSADLVFQTLKSSPSRKALAQVRMHPFLHSSFGTITPLQLKFNISERLAKQSRHCQNVTIFAQKRQGSRRKRKDKNEGPERMVKLLGTATAAVFSSALLAVTAVPLFAVSVSLLALLPVAATVFASLLIPLGIGYAFFSSLGLVGVTVVPNFHLSQIFFPWVDKFMCVILLFNFLGGAISLWGKLTKDKQLASVGELPEGSGESLSWGLPTVVSFIPGINGVAWLLPLSAASDDLPILRRAVLFKNAVLYGLPSFWHFIQFFSFPTSATYWSVSQLHAWSLALVLGAVHLQMEKIRMDEETNMVVGTKESKSWGGKGRPGKKAFTEDDEESLRQYSDLEYFDVLLRQRTGSSAPDSLDEWATGDVVEWLKLQGFARYASAFLEHDVDGPLLVQLTAEELRDDLEMGSLGDRKRILAAISNLKKQYK